MTIKENLSLIKDKLNKNVILVAVSKTKPVKDLLEAYKAGQRIFGENKIQEMVSKWEVMPKDVKWHMIGHVQRNKVKYMAPFVDYIHAVDSIKLLGEIQKQAEKNNRQIKCLIQIRIAREETKFGILPHELELVLESSKSYDNILIEGLMGMASFTKDKNQIRNEFKLLKSIYDEYQSFKILSMGMSGDFEIAIDEGSNMVRIGSLIFGARV